MKSTSTRCALLDELRGLDLISMMLYHGMWDLVYLFGVSAPWYGSWQGELWQQSICWVFLLLSGFCLRWAATRSNGAQWCSGAARLSRRSR